MSLVEYEGDLLTAEVDVIAHQCNCVSQGVSGLAAAVFSAFPQCNTYGERREMKYTTADIIKVEGRPFQYVANMYTQLLVGAPSPSPHLDDADRRVFALMLATEDVAQFMFAHGLTKIGFPRYYGCVLAGGDWEKYHEAFELFATDYTDLEVHIVGLPSKS